MSGLQVVSGVYAFMSPAKNIEMYGYEKEASETELAMMRYLAIGQVVLGATSLAGLEGGTTAAQSMALTGGAASLLACAPVFEVSLRSSQPACRATRTPAAHATPHLRMALSVLCARACVDQPLGGPKEPLAIWIGVMAVLGKAIRNGKVTSALPGTILGGVAAGQALIAPKKTWEMYKNKVAASEMALALFALAGGNLLANTAYCAVSKEKGHKKGLFASLAVLAVNCIKFGVLDANRVGFKPAGAIVWGLISAVGAFKLKD